MKWGVRRYQNEDGTLTATGKKREAWLNAKNPENVIVLLDILNVSIKTVRSLTKLILKRKANIKKNSNKSILSKDIVKKMPLFKRIKESELKEL